MHNAPSVVFPAGRSPFAGGLALLVWLAGSGATLHWVVQSGGFGGRQAIALGILAVASALALHGWLTSPAGELSWNGQNWAWSSGGQQYQGVVTAQLDVQRCLLLRFYGARGAPRWIWLERGSGVERWDDLRRAVYSRARTPTAVLCGPQQGNKPHCHDA